MTVEELNQRQRARIATIDECIALAEKVVAACVASAHHTDAIVSPLEDPSAHASRAGSINGAAAVLCELKSARLRAELAAQLTDRPSKPVVPEVAA